MRWTLHRPPRLKSESTIASGRNSPATDESAFWVGPLGGTVDAEDDWHSVYVEGNRGWAFSSRPTLFRPSGPRGVPQQIHPELYVDDVKAAHDEAMSLGARLLGPADDIESTEATRSRRIPPGIRSASAGLTLTTFEARTSAGPCIHARSQGEVASVQAVVAGAPVEDFAWSVVDPAAIAPGALITVMASALVR